MASVLINHPLFGSLWLSNVYKVKFNGQEYIVGDYWSTHDVGSSYLPDDYRGENETMNFPITCVRKWKEYPK